MFGGIECDTFQTEENRYCPYCDPLVGLSPAITDIISRALTRSQHPSLVRIIGSFVILPPRRVVLVQEKIRSEMDLDARVLK